MYTKQRSCKAAAAVVLHRAQYVLSLAAVPSRPGLHNTLVTASSCGISDHEAGILYGHFITARCCISASGVLHSSQHLCQRLTGIIWGEGTGYLGEGKGVVLATSDLGDGVALQAGHHMRSHHWLLHQSHPSILCEMLIDGFCQHPLSWPFRRQP